MGTVSPLYNIELRDKYGNPVPQGEIGVVQQRVHVQVLHRADREADAGAGMDAPAREIERLRQNVDEALGGRRRGGRVDDPVDQRELVAAEAGHDVTPPRVPPQPRGDLLQELVAGGMSVGVVDEFEPVEVDVIHGEQRSLVVLRRDQISVALAHRPRVGEVGQGVVMGQVGDALRTPPLLGDVLECRDPAAAVHDPVIDRQRAPVAEFARDRRGLGGLKGGAGAALDLRDGDLRRVEAARDQS